mgnify:CR=1 FL=1
MLNWALQGPARKGAWIFMKYTEQQLAEAAAKLNAAEAAARQILLEYIAAGVNIPSSNVYIEPTVVIEPGATILPGCVLRGSTVIKAGCVIGPNSLIEDSEIGANSTISASRIYGRRIGEKNAIGPFTHVRVNTVTDYGVHLGAYVETKNSNLAMGNTVSHLTYIGDSDVDILFARNAGARGVGCLWGFRGEAELTAAGAHFLAAPPLEILNCL